MNRITKLMKEFERREEVDIKLVLFPDFSGSVTHWFHNKIEIFSFSSEGELIDRLKGHNVSVKTKRKIEKKGMI